jgi:hypothetical protein
MKGQRKMIDFDNDLKAHRMVTMLVALLAATSAVSTAVAPAIF